MTDEQDPRITALTTTMAQLEQQLDGLEADDPYRLRRGSEVHQKLTKAKNELDQLKDDPQLTEDYKRLHAAMVDLTSRVLREIFKLDPEEFGESDAASV